MEGNQTSVIKSSDGDIQKLMAGAVPESTKRSLKYAVNRELKQTTTTTATRTSLNKRFNEQNNSCARAL